MLNINYDSAFKPCANKSFDWFPMDTKVLYENNLKKNYALMEKYGWINSSFKYSFNSHGFRSDEFTDDPTIMFLGGSNTMGIGLPIEQVWTSLLAKELNMKSANLSNAGYGSDTAFRLCHGWIDKIKPKIVILLEPHGLRMEVVTDSSVKLINAFQFNQYDTFVKDWIMGDTNMHLYNEKNHLGIKSLCDSRNIKYLHFKDDTFTNYDDYHDIGLARDLAHPGAIIHQEFIKHVLSELGSHGQF